MCKPPNISERIEIEVDTAPLETAQIQSLTADCLLQLRSLAEDLATRGKRYDIWLIDRLENQLCG